MEAGKRTKYNTETAAVYDYLGCSIAVTSERHQDKVNHRNSYCGKIIPVQNSKFQVVVYRRQADKSVDKYFCSRPGLRIRSRV